MKYTYLAINILAILVPFIFSFHPKLQFHKAWKAAIPSIIACALIFLTGDVLYTHWKVWGFNPDYLMGIYISNLPLEEVLFFICIPYACLFTYHCLEKTSGIEAANKYEKYITIPLILILILSAMFFMDRLYTFAASAGLAAILIFVRFFYKAEWLGKFYLVYGILLLPFLLVNGVLTGTGLEEPIVWYDDNENLGIRILSIPFEDLFYGMALILLNVFGFETLKQRYNIVVPQPA
ncbi:MAG: lycopene cyclase domain-containing protein [Bacteroidia bacterium]|nr:lycopene cyclase domain-containing protein [Bacteroidia bacterium]